MSDYLYAYYFQKPPAPRDRASFRQLAGLKGPLGPLSAVIFLLYTPTGEDELGVWTFLNTILPRLLTQLTRSTQIERVEMNSQVRGRVEWPATYKARYLADSNPALFVCRQNRMRFDEPENELLKYCLAQLQACLEIVPPALAEWQAWRVEDPARGAEPVLVREQLRLIAARLRSFRTNVYLGEVKLPKVIESRHLAAARTSKNELYGPVANLYELYHQVVEAESWERWAELLRSTTPLPPDFDATARKLFRN